MVNKNNTFFIQVELIINNNLFKKNIISENAYLIAQEKLISRLKGL